MKYRIDARYCWYNEGQMIVLMYFINNVPFDFEEIPDSCYYDLDLIHLADKERRWEPEDIYKAYYYLAAEECHPLLFELELENPECMPSDI